MKYSEAIALDIADVNRMTRKQLADVMRTVGQTINKRIDRLEATGNTDALAYRQVMNGEGKFTIKGKTVGELKHDFVRAQKIAAYKTGSVTKWKEVLKEAGKRVSGDKMFFENMTSTQRERYWEAYERTASALGVSTHNKEYSKRIQRVVRAVVEQAENSASSEEIAMSALDYLEDVEDEEDDFEEFDEFGDDVLPY